MNQLHRQITPVVKTPDWVKDAVFYQIFPDRFARSGSDNGASPGNFQPWGAPPTGYGFQGGDLQGIIDHLDYLEELGINAIYLNPIFASAANHRYHTHDYFQVDPILGGNTAFHKLLSAAHQRGIRIVLDGVFNHTGRSFFQFAHLLECGPESPYLDWFHIYGWPLNAYEGASADGANYSCWWENPALPKLNTDTPAVREFLWRVGEYWLEQGIDGWRLDVPDEIDDDPFWQEFRRRCKAVNPDAYIVGELWKTAHRWLSGDQFDAQMNYFFAEAALAFFGGENINQAQTSLCALGKVEPADGPTFAAKLEAMTSRYHPEIVHAQLNMLGSHDTARILTMLNEDKQALRMVFLCQMTMPGAPNIYYGDEIGMTGNHEPDSRRAFPWHAPHTWDHDLLREVQAMIRLRHDRAALRRGTFSVLAADKESVIYERVLDKERVIIAFNVANQAKTLTLSGRADESGIFPPLLDETGDPLQFGVPFTLPARTGRVWGNL